MVTEKLSKWAQASDVCQYPASIYFKKSMEDTYTGLLITLGAAAFSSAILTAFFFMEGLDFIFPYVSSYLTVVVALSLQWVVSGIHFFTNAQRLRQISEIGPRVTCDLNLLKPWPYLVPFILLGPATVVSISAPFVMEIPDSSTLVLLWLSALMVLISSVTYKKIPPGSMDNEIGQELLRATAAMVNALEQETVEDQVDLLIRESGCLPPAKKN